MHVNYQQDYERISTGKDLIRRIGFFLNCLVRNIYCDVDTLTRVFL